MSRMAWLVALMAVPALAADADKTAPVSRYSYSIKVDEKSLPKGVTVREVGEGADKSIFIKNAGDKPLVIDEIFSNGKLVSGQKLENGKVHGWFPNGVPMQGKTHLKGWQAPFGDVPEARLSLPREPETVAKGRKPGLGKDVPKPEESVVKVSYDGKPHDIKITIHYHLNKAYDKK